MDAFGDENFDENEIDPAAEFLAREQTELAGLEDELNTVIQSTQPPVPVTSGISNYYVCKIIYVRCVYVF